MKFNRLTKGNIPTRFVIVCWMVFMGFKPLEVHAVSQEQNTRDTVINEDKIEDTIVVCIFMNKEHQSTIQRQEPEYPGGDEAREKFLQENLVYPEEARQAGLEGCVVAEFVVEPNGSLSHFKIIRSAAPILDTEAIRVLKLMPNWITKNYQDKMVRVRYKIPIKFTLQ